MSKLILTRHGQSVWNAENRFTGWVDVDLSKKGVEEAERSGELIKELNIKIDISYTSFLKRAIRTLTTILQKNKLDLKFNTAWQLNERHYGSLTGLNKDETKKKLVKSNLKSIEGHGIYLHHQCQRIVNIYQTLVRLMEIFQLA